MDYRPAEAAKIIGVTVKTLQRWDQSGVFKAYRTPTNRRYYTQSQIEGFRKRRIDGMNIMEDLVEGKYILTWKSKDENDAITLPNGTTKVFVVDMNEYNENSDDYGPDLLYEVAFGDFMEFTYNGIPITEGLVYNTLYNHIVALYESGNADAGDEMYKIIHEYVELRHKNEENSTLFKLAREELLRRLS